MWSCGLARTAVSYPALPPLRSCYGRCILRVLLPGLFLAALPSLGQAQTPDPADAVCPRSAPGSVVAPPADLFSSGGTLEVTFTYRTVVDAQGLTRYCYISDAGYEAPTLHVNPGDQLIIHFQNALPAAAPASQMRGMKMPASSAKPNAKTSAASANAADCPGNGIMTASTTNLHFHGMNVAPTCGQDDVVQTMIQPGDEFDYDVQIPQDEPPGLYWYHPHPHGFSEGQVQGGAAGALIVEGIQNVNPSLANLPQRVFVLRDQLLPASEGNDANIPAWDISLNYVPVPYPNYPPTVVQTPPSEQEFWRILNASADTILNVQYVVNGVAQAVLVVAIDGYPIGSGGGAGAPQSETQTGLLLPPGARAEVVVTTPGVSDAAQLVTQYWNTGPDGDFDPARPIANIVSQTTQQTVQQAAASRLPAKTHAQKVTRFADLEGETPVAQRTLAFSEVLQDPSNPLSPTTFFITVAGQTPAVYDPSAPPNITVHQGTVEDWTVENTAEEDHIFHIHQLHFEVLAINGQPINDPAIRDTIDIPYWSGSGPYPSATLRMDFRDASIVGTFVYHCHILEHEDGGMMGTIQVLPSGLATTTTLSASSTDGNLNANVTVTAAVSAVSAGGPALTGTVQFVEDGNVIANAVPVSGGQATFTTAMSTAGGHTITALYSGDVNYNESVSDALAVGAEGFTLSAPGSTAVKGGTAGNAVITVTASPNFTSPIDFTCALPSSMTEAACFVNPSSISGSGQVTLTVNTTGPHALVGRRLEPIPPGMLWRVGLALGAVLLALFALRIPRTRWRISAVASLIVLAILSVAIGCGGGTKLVPGTPAGTYNVVATATSGSGPAQIVQTVVVPITVQ
jgi:FtsP/CotA-like multicopper oxidase with cupredoxin domain